MCQISSVKSNIFFGCFFVWGPKVQKFVFGGGVNFLFVLIFNFNFLLRSTTKKQFKGGPKKRGGANERLLTDQVTSGPIRGLEKNCI